MNNVRVVKTRGRRMLSLALFSAVLAALLALPMAAKAAPPVPDVVSVSPTCGPLAGNTAVLVTGTGFAGAEVTTVSLQLGGITYTQASGSYTPLGSFRVLGATQIEFRTVGSGAAGPRSVMVSTNGGSDTLAAAFDYNNSCAAATVTVNPASGSYNVQANVTGSGFTGVSSVTIGGIGVSYTFVNDGLLYVIPPNLSGSQPLIVNTNHGSGSSTFTYGAGTVTVNPASGTYNVQASVTGSGFTGLTSVTIGGFSASPTFVSDTLIYVVPPNLTGVQTLTVNTNHGSASSTFTYGAGTVSITQLTPACGPNLTATLVTITGTGFVSGQTTVSFGGYAGTGVFVNSPTSLTVYTPNHLFNTVVDVSVTVNGTTTSTNTVADNFTFGNCGTVTVNPASGAYAVTAAITGSGFTGVSSVTIGGITVSHTFSSDNLIYVSPPNLTGVQTLTVYTNHGSGSSTFTYGSGTVSVTQVAPTCGANFTATLVTVTGTGFVTGQTTVSFGGIPGTGVTVNSSTSLTVYTPTSLSNTAADVIVTVASVGTSIDTSADNFTFGQGACGNPTIVSVSPSSGPNSGGTTVTITGTNFVSGATSVTFGGTAGTSVNVTSPTTLTVVTPQHTGGQFDVIVTVNGQSSATSALTKFTFTGGTLTYTLSFRWTLIVWLGADGMTVSNAVAGNDGNSATNDLTAQVTLVARWNAPQQRWELSFPAQGNVPGANDFTTLLKGTAYCVAIAGPNSQSWIVQQG